VVDVRLKNLGATWPGGAKEPTKKSRGFHVKDRWVRAGGRNKGGEGKKKKKSQGGGGTLHGKKRERVVVGGGRKCQA